MKVNKYKKALQYIKVTNKTLISFHTSIIQNVIVTDKKKKNLKKIFFTLN